MSDLSDWQPLADHLRQVAVLAKQRINDAIPGNTELGDVATAMGLLHDLGKYRPEFQKMIRGIPVQREKTWHKQAGAAKAFRQKNLPVAFTIAGHHGGLPDATKLKELATGASGTLIANSIWQEACLNCPDLLEINLAPLHSPDLLSTETELVTRILFSCLVDADWEDTADHDRRIAGVEATPTAPRLEAETCLVRVLDFLRKRAKQCREPFVAAARAEVLDGALKSAEESPGVFSMTVPTGGGKTLSGLAFALRHALKHGLRRVIYVAPFLSIIEQNANVIREALGILPGDPALFEHHSLAEPADLEVNHSVASALSDAENQSRKAAAERRAENWDAPFVVTTSVQFFESLFANAPGKCRKLHNIARSVVLLDECQTLPPGFVAPTCQMLNQMVKYLGCSFVLCTATQPAFQHPALPDRLENVREIASPALNLFQRLRRVNVTWPPVDGTPLDWPAVADVMIQKPAALCIVNTRGAARDLYSDLKTRSKPVFHLSTSMCPAHRTDVLNEVKLRLKAKQACYLVSTQLIEAGVDIDFPFVMRELSPLEAIIQAAGRCNREGTLNGPSGQPGGEFVVFRSVKGAIPKDGWYETGRDVLTAHFLNNGTPPDIGQPDDIQNYFHRLYWTKGIDALDQHRIRSKRSDFKFEGVAEAYRLINDDSVAVLVASWAERTIEIDGLLDELKKSPIRENYRRLIPFQVNLRRHELPHLPVPAVEEVPGVPVWRGVYDSDLGFSPTISDTALIV